MRTHVGAFLCNVAECYTCNVKCLLELEDEEMRCSGHEDKEKGIALGDSETES